MSIEMKTPQSGDAAILTRLIRPEDDTLTKSAAKALLNIRFDNVDVERIRELVQKHQDEALTPDEKADLESYLRISSFLDLMHAKARRSLKKNIVEALE